MPRLLTAAKIAEGALRRIGAFTPRDDGPDADELDVALGTLDQIVGELTGTMIAYWLVPGELTFTLTPGTRTYNLLTTLGASYPDAGLQFPLSAWLQLPNDGVSSLRRQPLEIVRRRTYLAHDRLGQAGYPCEIYIDRVDPPSLSTFPVIALTGYSIVLHYQTYSSDETKTDGNKPHGLPSAWQRWLELAVAADIGDGPVRRLPGPRLQLLMQKAEAAKRELKAFNNREMSTRRAVAYRDF